MAGRKIYIVEDDSIIKMLINELISSMGHLVVGSAASVDAALDGIHASAPDLVILDIGLQGQKDGIDLANSINLNSKVPFVYVTGNSDDATIHRAKQTAPLGFIFKPFDEEIFTHQLSKLIESL